eukprot:115345_1
MSRSGPVRVTVDSLFSQCPHGLIGDYPVHVQYCKAKWTKGVYNVATKKSIWRPSWIYNVICLHRDCTHRWHDRMNFRSFRSGHWNKKHKNDNDIQFKVVSYWKTTANEGTITCIEEYKLVNTHNLEYIGPTDNDIDVQDTNSHSNQEQNDIDEDDDVLQATYGMTAIGTGNGIELQVHGHVMDTHSGHDSDQDQNTNRRVHNDGVHLNVDTDAVPLEPQNTRNTTNDQDMVVLNRDDANTFSDSNQNRNDRKRTLPESTNSAQPEPKRQRHNPEQTALPPSSFLEQITHVLHEMQNTMIELRLTGQELKDTQSNLLYEMQETKNELKETKDRFNELLNRFEQHQNNKDDKDKQRKEAQINNAMDLSLTDMESDNLMAFVMNEGKNIWLLEEAKEDHVDFILKCKLCSSSSQILSNQEIDSDAANGTMNVHNEPVDLNIKRSYLRGQFISSEQAESRPFFQQKLKSIKKHCKTNKRHLASLKIMNKDLNLCASNIVVKSEVAYQLFSRSEPDILFNKVMQMLHRFKHILCFVCLFVC